MISSKKWPTRWLTRSSSRSKTRWSVSELKIKTWRPFCKSRRRRERWERQRARRQYSLHLSSSMRSKDLNCWSCRKSRGRRACSKSQPFLESHMSRKVVINCGGPSSLRRRWIKSRLSCIEGRNSRTRSKRRKVGWKVGYWKKVKRRKSWSASFLLSNPSIGRRR